MIRPLAIAFAITFPLCAGEIRTWTNPDGTKTFKAEYVRRDETQVVLRPIGGRELKMGMDKLHENDRKWLKETHPTDKEKRAAEVPDDTAVFDTLKFGDNRDTVTEKLNASKMVETDVNSTFFGRTGLNGIYRTKHKIGGLHCYLFFDWEDGGGLREVSLRTEDKQVGDYESTLKPCWEGLVELIAPIYGKPLQSTKMPVPSEIASEQMMGSHIWRIDHGGTVMLGVSRLGETYHVEVLFTRKIIEPRPIP